MMDRSNLRERCHINRNRKGDCFVGLKSRPSGVTVCFPIGYQLSDNETGLRQDILHLFQVLTEFTKTSNKPLVKKKFKKPILTEFPVHAYLAIINDYMQNGYYTERDVVYKSGDWGTIDWRRTIQQQPVFVQEDLSPVYMQYTVRKSIADDNKAITQIHMYCVYESFVKLGWLFTEYMPRKFVNKLDVKKSVAILVDKLRKTRDHKNKRLFRSMLDILTQVDETCTGESFCFGTERFELIWERLIDRAFGIKDKRSYFPRTRWLLLHKKNKNNFPLVPDTIMIWDEKIYVLDAKYYNYGVTGNADHLPDSSSINKQITYGEYVAKQRQDQNVFNAFLIPYNSKENVFGMHTMFANIGMTVGDWKDNTHNYEKVQGILVDTRYLMYHYESKDNICALAESIQVALRVNNWLL